MIWLTPQGQANDLPLGCFLEGERIEEDYNTCPQFDDAINRLRE